MFQELGRNRVRLFFKLMCLLCVFVTSIIGFGSISTQAMVVIQPQTIQNNETQVFDFVVSAEEIATTEFSIEIPEEVTDIKPLVKDKWNIEAATDSNNNIIKVSWKSGTIIPAGSAETFQLMGTVATNNATIQWVVLQTNLDGSTRSYGVNNSDGGFEPIVTTIENTKSDSQFGFYIALISLGIALFALFASYLTGKKVDLELSALMKKELQKASEVKPKGVKSTKQVKSKIPKKSKSVTKK